MQSHSLHAQQLGQDLPVLLNTSSNPGDKLCFIAAVPPLVVTQKASNTPAQLLEHGGAAHSQTQTFKTAPQVNLIHLEMGWFFMIPPGRGFLCL